MTLTDSPARTIESDEVQVLFREAHRRRRRRWLISGIVLIVVAAVVAVLATSGASPSKSVARTRLPKSAPPQPVGLPTGAVQSLKSAGPLAVNAIGSLFVVDETSHEILVRLNDGKFRVVAGDGVSGYAGDGGPATRAELSDVTDLTFGPNEDLYLADNGRVRVIDPQGVIETIISPGGTNGLVTSGASAGSLSSDSQIASVAVSPSGVIYAGTPNRIYRLTPTNQLQPITAIAETVDAAGTGQALAPINSFGQIAVDSQGDIYASSVDIGWSVYKITPDGVATYLGAARGSGGALADVRSGPGNTAYAGNGNVVVRAEGNQLVPSHTFLKVPGSPVFYMQHFAFAPNGTLFADNIGESAFSRYQEIVAVSHGGTTALWRRRVRN
jgi:hypothetical protein